MAIRNFTPHVITILDAEDQVIARYPSDGVVRAEEQTLHALTVDGIPVVSVDYLPPVGLPEPEDGTWVIVTKVVYQATLLGQRPMSDLLTVADLVRDPYGRVIGCRALAIPTPMPRSRWL